MKNLKQLFDHWAQGHGEKFAQQQWLLSKWESYAGIPWSEEKISVMMAHIAEGLDMKEGCGRMLDVGCGGGWILKYLSSNSRVVGVDLSQTMLRTGREVWSEAPLVAADAAKLPFANESFDRLLCYFVLINIQDLALINSIFKECFRVIRPGGCLLIGQIPDPECSSDYDKAKEDYIKYCQEHYTLGENIRDQVVVPLHFHPQADLIAMAEGMGLKVAQRNSFNPFYRSGADQTVSWRYDLLLSK